MPKLTDIQKKKIIADYVNNGNFSATARMNGLSVNGVKKIVQKDENCAKMCKQKKEENTKTILEYMQTQIDIKKSIISKILTAINDKADASTNIKDLATIYGILLDKELKFAEITKNKADDTQMQKVEELLSKIKDEANGTNR